eukprot:5525349-Amphidinium_carterae.1
MAFATQARALCPIHVPPPTAKFTSGQQRDVEKKLHLTGILRPESLQNSEGQENHNPTNCYFNRSKSC